jgi:hypothetical protein
MSDDWDLKICCMGAGYVGGPTMAVIAKQCPKVRQCRCQSSPVDRCIVVQSLSVCVCVLWYLWSTAPAVLATADQSTDQSIPGIFHANQEVTPRRIVNSL